MGNRTTTTATVRIDRFPPRVTMTSPSDRLVTADGTLTVTGAVSDDGSGVGRVTCNGMPVQLGEGGAVSCDVPLRPGLNPIILHATDVAGNSASVGVRATRVVPAASLSIAPSQRTILVGETRSLQVVDQGGLPVASDVGWTVDNAAVASLTSESGMATVQGLAAGTATVTVTHAGLTATAEINVIAAASLPTGAVRWKSLAGSSGIATTSGPLYATRVDDAVPDLYVLQGAVSGRSGCRASSSTARGRTRGMCHRRSQDRPTCGWRWQTGPAASCLARGTGAPALEAWCGFPGRPTPFPGATIPPRSTRRSSARVRTGQSTCSSTSASPGRQWAWMVTPVASGSGTPLPAPVITPSTTSTATRGITRSPSRVRSRVAGRGIRRCAVCPRLDVDFGLRLLLAGGLQPERRDTDRLPRDRLVVRVTADGTGRVDELQTKAGTTSDALDLHGDTLVPIREAGSTRNGTRVRSIGIRSSITGGHPPRVGLVRSPPAGSRLVSCPSIGSATAWGSMRTGAAYDLDTMAVKFTPPVAGTFVTALAGGGVAVTDGITLSEIDGYGEVVRQATMVAVPDVRYGGGPLWTTVDSDGVTALERPDLNSHAPAFPDVNLSRHPSDPVYLDRTQDEAAIAALKRFHGKSVKEFTEYGGQVCEVTGAAAPARFGVGPAHWGLPCQFFSPCSVDPRRFPVRALSARTSPPGPLGSITHIQIPKRFPGMTGTG